MSAPSKSKPTSSKSKASDIPVVNVFDEEVKDTAPAPRRSVVVEIEDVPPQAPEQPVTEQPQTLPTPTEITVEPTVDGSTAPAAKEPEVSFAPPLEAPAAPVAPAPETVQPSEPALPSFFEHDLKGEGVVAPAASAPTVSFDLPQTPQAAPANPGVVPQAVVGEIHEINEGGNSKKIIGIILILIAVVLLGIGAFVVYSKTQTATPEPTPTPISQPTATPTPLPSATPQASDSASLVATNSAEFVALKKKYKVDVLNGTKVAGLASKQAALIKKEGYTTGTVGNGDEEKAGTITVPTAAAALAKDLERILSDFTFTVTEDAKATGIVVTLGEPN